MSTNSLAYPNWLTELLETHKIILWGVAELRGISTPLNPSGGEYPSAISFAIPMNPIIMNNIKNGPNQPYADEYAKVNSHINMISSILETEIKGRGFQAKKLAASVRSDPLNIKGDFPHKTAATKAGLGWIGRHCQLITRPFGSWVRLGTVFVDIELPCGPPVEKNYCGDCQKCVEACPAKALKGNKWYPGLAREEILDVQACDQWKKEHYFKYHKGHNCGICSAVCPYGQKVLKRIANAN